MTDTVVEDGTWRMTKIVATIQKGKQKKNSLVILDLERRWKLIKALKKKVLITGAGSYIGQSFIDYAKNTIRKILR